MVDEWPLVGRDDELSAVADALANEHVSGLVLVGEGGVGKTRLAVECLDLGRTAGYATARVTATRSSAELPFGALAPLLPTLDAGDLNVLAAARAALAAQSSAGRLMLLIDDAHLLDGASASLLLQMVSERVAFVLVTIRAGEEVPDAITTLWKDGFALRRDVTGLTPLEINRLTTTILGGPLDPSALQELARLAHGNPLALRELVVGAREGGALADDGGTWRLVGRLPVSSRLTELVGFRLDSLNPEERGLLELVAVGEPLPISYLDEVPDALVDALERKLLIRVRDDGDGDVVFCSHPLHAEIVREQLAPLRRRRLLRRLVDAASAAKRDGDVPLRELQRLAWWQLELGDASDTELLLQATRLALAGGDAAAAVRLGDALWEVEPSVELALELSPAHLRMLRFPEAEQILDHAARLAKDDDELTTVTALQMQVFLVQGKNEESSTLLAGARDRITDAACLERLEVHELAHALVAGTVPRLPDNIGDRLATLPDGDLVLLGTLASWTLTLGGLPDQGLTLALAALAAVQRLAEITLTPPPADIAISAVLSAQLWGGQLGELLEGIESARVVMGPRAGQMPNSAVSLLSGLAQLMQGRVDDGYELLRAAGGAPAGTWPSAARVYCAIAAAYRGEAAVAAELIESVDATILVTPLRPIFHVARGWQLVAAGFGSQAAEAFELAITECLPTFLTVAWEAAHGLARTGLADRAAALTAGLDPPEGTYLSAIAQHIGSAGSDDAQGVFAAAESFERSRASLLAAEAFADASRRWMHQGRRREATRAANRSAEARGRCQSAATPGLLLPADPVALSDRELEIARLALEGLSAPAIAERTFLSARTVNNHLAKVYDKLGINGRDGLAEALGRSPS